MAYRGDVDIRRSQPRAAWYDSTTDAVVGRHFAQARADSAAVTGGGSLGLP